MKRVFLFMLLSTSAISCSNEDLALDGQAVKARVLYRSCAGTILQMVDQKSTVGKDWLWFTDPNGPQDGSNQAKVYPRCVSAFDIPTSRQVVGDTLEFTYKELAGPSGLVCAIGGLPAAYISVRELRGK